MSTLIDDAASAAHVNGMIVIRMKSGREVRFPVSKNPRLVGQAHDKLNRIEISPFGLHWPELDEDLSFKGIAAGDYGQNSKTDSANRRRK